ncbi:frizzled-2 [Venturia canescens]|uniref:frizzled-2 n=1 Tax=Venturia canescens TaxID=32260 RepID=UPI001C9C0D8F|nr:frizzled-2 [Venturia canescens]XP_043284477.1 frizzled-2 [Venturia canescens]XP_043284478.1 frizzled-2 [Venturia canescens]XP_043284479.1 frizzled-2 [Venturia canescens]
MGLARRPPRICGTMAAILPIMILLAVNECLVRGAFANVRSDSAIGAANSVGPLSGSGGGGSSAGSSSSSASSSSAGSSSPSSSSAIGVLPGSSGSSGSLGSGGSGSGLSSSGSGHSVMGGSMMGSNSRCEDIKIPMCHGIGYNLTAMPNELNHDTQDEAGLEVHQFWPLVEIKCSPDLKFFLCSMYTPICLPEYSKPLPACRSVCERARAGCAPLMRQYGFSWPERMACERLPVQGDPENLCMEQDNHASTNGGAGGSGGSGGPASSAPLPAPGPPRATRPPKTSLPARCKPGKNQKNCQHPPGDRTRDCTCRCRAPLVTLGAVGNGHGSTLGGMHMVGSHGLAVHPGLVGIAPSQDTVVLSDCALPCHGAFLTGEERDFVAVWLAMWSGLCAASTLTTVTTFLIDTQRFKYPERPIVFLSACYFVVSLGYLARSVLGHEEIACEGSVLRSGAQGPGMCVTVFLMIYFFGMASSVWWVILAFTWFLAAGLKWGNEAIASYSQYFHLAAWLAPTAQTVWALLAGGVAGDPVAGVCTVAPEGVRTFILVPLLVYLLLGTSFLLAGFVSLFRIRSVIKRQPGAKADKLEKLMIRIGVFSVLYTVPASAVLGCHLYESTLREAWLGSLACPCLPRSRPLYSVLMLKYFMALAVGITSGVWIWSGKTLDSWRRLWRRLFGGGVGAAGGNGAGMAGVTGVSGIGSASIKGVVGRAVMPQYQTPSGPGSALLPPGSVASASQHHLHHHVLKQPPLSHV